MSTAKNLQIVSLYFFLATGLAHFISGLMYVNDFYSTTALMMNKVSDLPFFVSTLLYFGASMKIALDPDNRTKLHKYFFTIGALLFIAVLIVNFFLPDRI